LDTYIKKFKAKPVDQGFSYSSGKNDEFLTVDELRQLIVDHV